MKLRLDDSICQRWPDRNLVRDFDGIRTVYERLVKFYFKRTSVPGSTIKLAYSGLCGAILRAHRKLSHSRLTIEPRNETEDDVLQQFVAQRKYLGRGWLQRLSSILGMLLHFEVGSGSSALVNNRRPGKRFTTYPTSPPLALGLSDFLVSNLLNPERRRALASAGSKIRGSETFHFRILDPSMESGQFLLSIAESLIKVLHKNSNGNGSDERQRVARALRYVCSKCLWGVDRNPLARVAVNTVFSLLGEDWGIRNLRVSHLFACNALSMWKELHAKHFDAVINNPPWGEVTQEREKRWLRKEFTTLEHRSDTYVAFSELGLRVLRPGTRFVFVLPASTVTAGNASGLRRYIAENARIEHLIVLPRAAFADASVRGLVVAGRKGPAERASTCAVQCFPLEYRFDTRQKVRVSEISPDALRSSKGESWWTLLTGGSNGISQGRCVQLGRVALVLPGVQVYGEGMGHPPQTARVVRERRFSSSTRTRGMLPAIHGRDVHPFRLANAIEYIAFGPQLARTGGHKQLLKGKRIFVREMLARNGRLIACRAASGVVGLHGVLTVAPKCIDLYCLLGILISEALSKVIRTTCSGPQKVDFQRITVSEMRGLPIPVPVISPRHRRFLDLPDASSRELGLQRKLKRLVQSIGRSESSVRKKFDRTMEKIEIAVRESFDFK